jgi:hypothetical protein
MTFLLKDVICFHSSIYVCYESELINLFPFLNIGTNREMRAQVGGPAPAR